MSNEISHLNEGEQFNGFHQARSCNAVSAGNVAPDAAESKLDCTLYTGDNLSSLQRLSESHKGSVGLCYIDPPYNTGSKFLYKDSRKSEDVGVFGRHSDWMAFMTPRLVAARALLREDGVIAVSIDDYEFAYLKVLMDQVFGEESFIGNIVVCRSKNGKGSKSNIAPNHEYLLVYGKSKAATLRGAPDDEDTYDKQDEYGKYRLDGLFRKKGQASLRSDRPNLYYPLYYDHSGNVYLDNAEGRTPVYPVDSRGVERRWVWGKDTARANSWKLYASPKGTVYIKNYSSKKKRVKIRTLWDSSSYYTERGTAEIKNIFGDKIFDTPKPLEFIKDIIDRMSSPDDLVLDFFAGSGTTAHAVFELNKASGSSRRVMLMESNEAIPGEHLASKHGYERICDITKGRLEYLKGKDSNFNYRVIN